MADGVAAGEASIRERARDLRRAGLSVAQIADALGRKAHSPVQRWVADIAPPDWTRRPNAKDDLREAARALRRQGHNYREIAGKLTVSTSSVSLWVRDIEVPEALRRRAEHANRMNSERWVVERAAREEARMAVKGAARDGVGPVSDRELLLAGAVLYWAEGAKDKPYDRRERVSLINSDPGVVVLFERWLDLMEVSASRRSYRLSIHETADIAAAHVYWAEVVRVPTELFKRPTLKRHNPKTVRRNTGQDYRGCLIITVSQSRVLYQQIDGLFHGLVASVSPSTPASSDTEPTV